MIPQFKVFMAPEAGDMVSEVLASGYIGQGEKVEEFERELKSLLRFDYGVTVNSCTSALWLALHLIGVRPGSFVISTPMTCSATNEVIHLLGGKIIWADVDEFGNIDPQHVAQILKSGVKPDAIVAVDWGGMPCDYDELRLVANGIPIVEDAAHALFATYKGKSVAQVGGDYVAYSFQAIKHLTTGDGGLLVVPPEQYERAKLLRWYGLDRTSSDAMRCRQDIREAGFKFHMNDINATIGLANEKYVIHNIVQHQENAAEYQKAFEPLGLVPKRPPFSQKESADWIYTIHVPEPVKFETFMKGRGIGASQVHNRNDDFTCFWRSRTELPNLDKWFSTMCAIPVGWWLTQSDRQYIIESVKDWLKINGS